MNIDIESIGLLSLILQDSPKDRQLILCVLARSNATPARITFNPNTDYPTFYGYSNSRIPLYLMGKGVLSNVPRKREPTGHLKRLISAHYMSHTETIINRAKNWDIHQKLWEVAKFITLDNKTLYKDAEVFLVFKDKALDYIKGYATSHEPEYQEFTGNKPPAPIRTKLSRKSLEKIWGVLQEIEDKRGITSANDDISIQFVHFGKVRDDIGANNAADERRNVLRKLENEENAIKDVRLPDKLREYVYLKIGDRYFEVFDYYEKEYKSAAKNYQQEQQASQHTDSLKDQYKQLLKEIKDPSQPSLEERYTELIKDIKPKQQKNNKHKPLRKPLVVKKQPTCEWSEDFKWQGKNFVFGTHGVIDFSSKTIITLFRELTNAKGGWVTITKLKEVTGKNDDYVRPTIGQLERRMKQELRKHISIPSTKEDDLQPMPSQGAYRIKFIPKPL